MNQLQAKVAEHLRLQFYHCFMEMWQEDPVPGSRSQKGGRHNSPSQGQGSFRLATFMVRPYL